MPNCYCNRLQNQDDQHTKKETKPQSSLDLMYLGLFVFQPWVTFLNQTHNLLLQMFCEVIV